MGVLDVLVRDIPVTVGSLRWPPAAENPDQAPRVQHPVTHVTLSLCQSVTLTHMMRWSHGIRSCASTWHLCVKCIAYVTHLPTLQAPPRQGVTALLSTTKAALTLQQLYMPMLYTCMSWMCLPSCKPIACLHVSPLPAFIRTPGSVCSGFEQWQQQCSNLQGLNSDPSEFWRG
jgi:hypothetical protein